METVRFDELQLDERIFRAVTDMGFEAASPIQAQAIPVQMEGRDVVGPDRNRKDSGIWYSAFTEDRS